jgi:lipopolysaccharide export system permease protein
VFLSILQRMILWELIKIFTMALVAITGLFLLAGIVQEATQQGLSPGQVLLIIPLLIPSSLPFTIPATTLFATCIVYGRLAHDNEILAVRAAGIHLLKLLRPALLLGLVMSCVTMALYYHTIPYTHRLLRSLFLNDAEELLYSALKRDHQISHRQLNYAIFVEAVHGRKLINALFKKRNPITGQTELTAHAYEAELRVNMATREIEVWMRNAHVSSPGDAKDASGKENAAGTTGFLQDKIWQVPLPPNFSLEKQTPKPRDRTWPELFDWRRDLVDKRTETIGRTALDTAEEATRIPPQQLPQHLENLNLALKYIDFDIRSVDAEVQMRPALAFGCLCFVLIGCPVGIWLSKSDYLSAFITCFLPIVFFYYPLLLCGTNLAKNNAWLPAPVSVWMADALVALVGLFLWRRLLRN